MGTKRKKKFKAARKIALRVALGLCVVGLVTFVLYAIHAGRLLTEKMTGRIWALPSRIYAAPENIFPGVRMPKKHLVSYLQRIGYHRVDEGRPEAGQWKVDGWDFEIGIRSFRGPASSHPDRTVRVRLFREKIGDLSQWKGGTWQELATVTLEPEVVGEFFGEMHQQRSLLRLEEVPQVLRDSILLMEDRHFFSHFGISIRGTLRAFWTNLTGWRVRQGGSTLTQQLMKNFFLVPERTLRRKMREAVMTLVAELLYSKEKILEAYINEIYLGQKGSTAIHGFGEAAKHYFARNLRDLSIGEQALLAGLISSPGLYSPLRHPERAQERRRVVLEVLLENERISQDDFDAAVGKNIALREFTVESWNAPYFLDLVRQELERLYPAVNLAEEGYEIHTTIDPFAQHAAQAAVEKGMKQIEKKARSRLGKEYPEEELQTALVSMVPQTGAIRALVGGRNYSDSQFNRVVMARRQPGSAVKPFVAALALASGNSPTLLLDDQPATFAYAGREWSPTNYDDKYFGTVTLRRAIEKSLNVATVNLAARVGIERLARFFRRVGFEDAQPFPSLALGSAEITPLRLASAYSTFPNGGMLTEPRGITAVLDQEGQRLGSPPIQIERVLTEEAAYQTTHILKGVVDRGTARSVRAIGLKGNYAGKTGTTDEYRDSWFVGMHPSLITVVWVGFDESPTTKLTGASGALPIWIRFMKEIEKKAPKEDYLEPPGLRWFEVDLERGCVGGQGETIREAFQKSQESQLCIVKN